MSVLVVGISHRSAPVPLLERVAVDGDGAAKLLRDVAAGEHVSEAAIIATCNRLEMYADVDRFHGSVEELSVLLVERAGLSTEQLLPHLYVHYDDGAVSHLFQVAAGLDSMAVGEGQILGQTREALARAQEAGTAGPALNLLFQQALRVG
jgi:glutamyl-tRNA reductase